MLGGRFRAEMPRRFGGFFRNDADHRDFTAIGTAAGLPQTRPYEDVLPRLSPIAWNLRSQVQRMIKCATTDPCHECCCDLSLIRPAVSLSALHCNTVYTSTSVVQMCRF